MWQRYLVRFVAFTATLPVVLLLWAAYYQGRTIVSYWIRDESSHIALSRLQMLLATLFFLVEILWAGKFATYVSYFEGIA